MKILKPIILNFPYILSLIVVLISINISCNIKLWKTKSVIQSDVIFYYGYLPATFIYHDYTLKFVDNYNGPHQFLIWTKQAPNGEKIFPTTIGMSMLFAPFFFVADDYAQKHPEYDAGGYSDPYQISIIVCALFYFALGLYFLSKLLLHFFNPYISSLVLLITAGSNLFYYATFEPGMSHTYNFTLITCFVWFTIKWYENQKPIYTILIGILIGLISLIRPTNTIIALFFILYDIKSWKDVISRIQFFLLKYKHIVLIITLCLFVWLPQFLLWKSITGSFLFYSYGEECKFFWNNPQIFNGLFSYRNGWLVYTPSMIFAVVGLFFLWKKQKDLQLSIAIIFLAFVYVTYSWFIWWYGGSFGSRPMIDMYGLLALSIGAFFTYIYSLKRKWIIYPVFMLAFLLTIAGLHHIDKRRHFSLHWDSMTKEAFWYHYFQKNGSPTFDSKLRAPDYTKALEGIYQYADESEPTK